MTAVGGCCACVVVPLGAVAPEEVLPDAPGGDIVVAVGADADDPVPVVWLFMVAVGGCCCPLPLAAEDAVLLVSAWFMTAVGGCCALVAAPVGPEPASLLANSC